jgi:hypothetical protein
MVQGQVMGAQVENLDAPLDAREDEPHTLVCRDPESVLDPICQRRVSRYQVAEIHALKGNLQVTIDCMFEAPPSLGQRVGLHSDVQIDALGDDPTVSK